MESNGRLPNSAMAIMRRRPRSECLGVGGAVSFDQSRAPSLAVDAKVESMVDPALVSIMALKTSNMGRPNAAGTTTLGSPTNPADRA